MEILQLATRTEQDRMANASLNESTSMRKPEMPGEGNVRSATTRSTRRRLSLPFHPSEIRFKSCRPCRSSYFAILDRHGSATNEINKKKSKREKNNEKKTHSSVLCVCFGIALLWVDQLFSVLPNCLRILFGRLGDPAPACSSLNVY